MSNSATSKTRFKELSNAYTQRAKVSKPKVKIRISERRRGNEVRWPKGKATFRSTPVGAEVNESVGCLWPLRAANFV